MMRTGAAEHRVPTREVIATAGILVYDDPDRVKRDKLLRGVGLADDSVRTGTGLDRLRARDKRVSAASPHRDDAQSHLRCAEIEGHAFSHCARGTRNQRRRRVHARQARRLPSCAGVALFRPPGHLRRFRRRSRRSLGQKRSAAVAGRGPTWRRRPTELPAVTAATVPCIRS
jgi:hypothetical protein